MAALQDLLDECRREEPGLLIDRELLSYFLLQTMMLTIGNMNGCPVTVYHNIERVDDIIYLERLINTKGQEMELITKKYL